MPMPPAGTLRASWRCSPDMRGPESASGLAGLAVRGGVHRVGSPTASLVLDVQCGQALGSSTHAVPGDCLGAEEGMGSGVRQTQVQILALGETRRSLGLRSSPAQREPCHGGINETVPSSGRHSVSDRCTTPTSWLSSPLESMFIVKVWLGTAPVRQSKLWGTVGNSDEADLNITEDLLAQSTDGLEKTASGMA